MQAVDGSEEDWEFFSRKPTDISSIGGLQSSGGDKSIEFNRADFVKELRGVVNNKAQEGLVLSMAVQQEFSLKVCDQLYPALSNAQKRQFILAIAQDLALEGGVADRDMPFQRRLVLASSFLGATFGQSSQRRVKRPSVPLHMKALYMFGSTPAGMNFLLDLRRNIIMFLGDASARMSSTERIALKDLSEDVRNMFYTYQSVLAMKEVGIESREILRFIVVNEAVQSYYGWTDLERRMSGTRRKCFAFFHPRVNVPLAYVSVALLSGMCNDVQHILEGRDDPGGVAVSTLTHAVFYSINTPHVGLRGLNIASYLLFRAAHRLHRHHPSLTHFVTISPVPGFRPYVRRLLQGRRTDLLLSGPEGQSVVALASDDGKDAVDWLQTQLETVDWPTDERVRPVVKALLLQLCAHFVLFVKQPRKPADGTRKSRAGGDGADVRASPPSGGKFRIGKERSGETAGVSRGRKICDPVANFHMQNGAEIYRVLFLGDTSTMGMRRSYGMMMSYRYPLQSPTHAARTTAERGQHTVEVELSSLSGVREASSSYHKYSTVAATQPALQLIRHERMPMFDGLSHDAVEGLELRLLARIYYPGEWIIEPYAAQGAIGFVSHGVAEEFAVPDTSSIDEWRAVGSGEYFGDREVIAGLPPRPARAQTVCYILLCLQDELQNAMRRFPDVGARIRDNVTTHRKIMFTRSKM